MGNSMRGFKFTFDMNLEFLNSATCSWSLSKRLFSTSVLCPLQTDTHTLKNNHHCQIYPCFQQSQIYVFYICMILLYAWTWSIFLYLNVRKWLIILEKNHPRKQPQDQNSQETIWSFDQSWIMNNDSNAKTWYPISVFNEQIYRFVINVDEQSINVLTWLILVEECSGLYGLNYKIFNALGPKVPGFWNILLMSQTHQM